MSIPTNQEICQTSQRILQLAAADGLRVCREIAGLNSVIAGLQGDPAALDAITETLDPIDGSECLRSLKLQSVRLVKLLSVARAVSRELSHVQFVLQTYLHQ